MFSIDEIREASELPAFKQDISWVRDSLALKRLNLPIQIRQDAANRLLHFIESVLASATDWPAGSGRPFVLMAAESAELLATLKEQRNHHLSFKASLLYELAELPALAGTTSVHEQIPLVRDYFARSGLFKTVTPTEHSFEASLGEQPLERLGRLVMTADTYQLALYEQGEIEDLSNLATNTIATFAGELALGYSATEFRAMAETIARRSRRATLPLIGKTLATKLRVTGFPAELFPAQVQAIREGLLDKSYDSWGFAAPTGTGKTFLSRLLALDAIEASADAKILYLVPSKALVYEITQSLGESLKPAGIRVGLVSPQLTALDRDEQAKLQETSLVVVTPEKADLLLRIGADFLSQVSLIVVDEAHHIEAGTRGALLEFYLWRLRRMLSSDVRIIFLSALAPNIENLAQWMGRRPKGVVVDQRSTRMRVGVYKIETSARQKHGVIEYVNTGRVTIVDRPESSNRRALVQLADRVSGTGPVLVVAKGKGECETLAHEMLTWLQEHERIKTLSDAEIKSEPSQRLDSRLEREMYKDIGLRKLFPFRIAYHHAGLPPRVRTAIEDAIRKNLIDFVFSTTTLADGVNFPFSTVIIQSLALKEAPERGRPSRYAPVTPRTFWNIAGRAGRPGFDSEGQVLLFEPTLSLDKIAYTLEPYLNTSWRDIEPVKSALKTSLDELNKEITEGVLSRDSLNEIALSDEIPRRVRGTVNLIRIALIHSKTFDTDVSPEEIIDGTFAFRGANAEERRFALSIVSEQLAVVEEFLRTNGALSAQLVAELGLSIETLSELRDYVISLQNFQIQAFGRMFYGGTLNVDQAKYVVGPVSKRMAELEGRRLGGFYSDVIVHWLQGLPLAEAPRINKARNNSIEQLVSVMYTQVQYLLPWGLYAFDKLVELEATRRKISYNNEIKNLAYLADAGVPSFDALRLVDHEIERVDASRLAAYYRKSGGPALGVDVTSWVASLSRQTLERYVRGIDQRRLDYDLHRIVEQLRLSR